MNKLIFVFILLIPLSSALIISEVELNPLGSDSGREWIEFYSENLINNSYELVNNDGDKIFLNFSFEGYFVHNFEKQWLDNSDEKVFLYKNGNLIDSTTILEDNQNDNLAFSFCGNWEFIDSSKGEKNNCVEEVIEEEEVAPEGVPLNEETESKEVTKIEESGEEKEQIPTIEKEIKQKETIILNPQTIKREETNSSLEDKWFVKYSFGMFAAIILFLFITKRKKRKNEWTK